MMANHNVAEEMFRQRIDSMNRRMNLFNHEKNVLKNLDLFVLDNSLRENAVGSTRGHTIENRWKIYNEVKRCGFRHIAIASFKHMTRTGEEFLRQLQGRGENINDHFAFVEFLDSDEPPIGLIKCKEFGIKNVVLELDLMYRGIDYNIYTGEKICQLLKQRFNWIRQNLSPNSLIFVNFRDFSETMMKHPARVFYIVHFLSTLPENERIFGLCFEDEGKCYSEQLAVWTSCVREEMDKCRWRGHLLTNIHEQYGLSTTTQMDCLADGATGVWAGLAEEGATMGHISSTITIMNLIRLGNTRVLGKFKCNLLSEASANVTRYITGEPPHPRQPAVGDRALGVCYELPHLDNDVDLEQTCASSITRLTHRSSTKKINAKLLHVFGGVLDYDKDLVKRMKELMAEDAKEEVYKDYNSRCGLALLYERAGGAVTNDMKDAVSQTAANKSTHERVMKEIRAWWDEWDLRDAGKRNDDLDFFAFYNGFMAPYFGNSRSNDTHRLLEQIGFLQDGQVNWNRFKLHLEFAVGEYPHLSNGADVINVAFRESLIVSLIEILIEESAEKEKFYQEYEYNQDSFFSALAVQTNIEYPAEDLVKAEDYFNEFTEKADKELDGDKISYDIMVKTSSFTASADNVYATICIFGEKKSTAMFTLEDSSKNKRLPFDTGAKHNFEIDAIDVGKIKKIKIQLICDGPASWGLDSITVKSKDDYVMFRTTEVIEQTRDPRLETTNYFDRFHATLQLFAEVKEGPKVPYNVNIKTKNYEGFSADTLSDVHIIIFGEAGNTGKMKFDLAGMNRKKMFDKITSHSFSFNGSDVGKITNIRITHSNNETTAKWLLEYVKVKVNDETIEFQANQWLRKAPYSNQLRIDLFAQRPASEGSGPTSYEVDLRTGEEGKPGKAAKLTIQLHGKYGSTEQVALTKSIRNAEQKYKFSEKDIGKIHRISIGHDDIGNDAKWYLEGVSVLDCKLERTLEFSASQWLNANTSADFYPKVKDNKDHLETYHVITKTGTLPEASTDANVFIVLKGDNGETEHILLDDDCDYDLFEHDSEDVITINAPDVGSIHTIKIGHDNEGRSANWYVEGVDVIHPAHDESVDFLAEKWLGDSISRRDGGIQSVEAELFPVAEAEDDNYVNYAIEVKTGDYVGPTENAQVNVCLVGECYNTGKLPLEHVSGNNAKIFDKTNKHLFSLQGIDIGSLYKIRITHNNPEGNANWYLDWVVVKTRMYFIKIQVDKWMTKNERTGQLFLDLFPPEDAEPKEKYQITLMTNNFHGFDPDTEVDPVWLCVFGDKGNTGMINWRMPEHDKTEIFDKSNKHYMTFESPSVGLIQCVRVIHTNYSGDAEWKIDYVQVKGDGQNVKFKCKEWLEKTTCDNRLQLDIYAPKPTKPEDQIYKLKVTTGDMDHASTDANVFVNFHGTYGESGKIQLQSDKKKPFQIGQEDTFSVSAVDVGRLYKITVSHDNTGDSPDWYLDTLVAQQPYLERTLDFDIRNWIDEKKGGLEKDLYPKTVDNPHNTTTYHMTVKTGDFADSGTDANVYVQFFGEGGRTEKIMLDEYGRGQDLFEQDNEDIFTFDAPDVGPVTKIKIGHDNQGKNTDWFVRWISVLCPSMTDSLTFHANQWISSKKVDSNLEVELTEVVNEDIPYDIIVKSSSFSSSAANVQASICIFGEKKYTAMQVLETKDGDKKKVFDVNTKQQFDIDALDVGKIKKIKVQLACDAPARWGIDWIVVKTYDQFLNFRINEVLEQNRDPQKDKHNFSDRYQASLQVFAQIKEEPKIPYYVTIKTKNYNGFSADTMSDVHIVFFGDKGNSGRLQFQFAGFNRKKMFDKNNSHTFDFHAKDVGNLTNIRITHSNNEKTAQWFLDFVNVQVKDTEVRFEANQWLRKSPYSDQLRLDLFTPADESKVEETAIYHVITKTGTLPEASTDANVYVVLKGDDGETEQVLLDAECDYDLFENDQEDIITVIAPNVGNIHSIKVGHDNEGRSANWYLEGVDVINPSYNESLEFQAQQWLGDPTSRRDGGMQIVETELFHVPEADSDHEIAYSIELKTRGYSGPSDAKVQICIQGENQTTGTLQLTDTYGGKIFDTSTKQMFVFKAIYVGDPQKIKIIHENPTGKAEWFLETIVIKTRMYYKKLIINKAFVKNEASGFLVADVIPPRDEYAKVTYKMTLVTANYHGFDPDSDVDPVWLCVFGDKGNTGMINWKCPEGDKTEIFEKQNKHYMTFEATDVGTVTCVRVIHTNYEGDSEWCIDYVSVQKGDSSVKFKCKEWLKPTNCDNRIQLDIYEKRGKAQQSDVAVYKVKTKTGQLPDADTQANVYINFHGAYGETGNILLEHSDSSRQLYQQGQEDDFVITASDVGRISKISIGHDNNGSSPKWYLDWLQVDVPGQEQKVMCRVEQWLERYTGESLVNLDVVPRVADNPDYMTTYHIATKTGDFPESSTDANVFVQIFGEGGDTGKIMLDLVSGTGDLFEQDNEDVFTVQAPDVGPITKIRVGHDNQGDSGNWFVRWLDVLHPRQLYSHTFPADFWLSDDMDDKQLQRDIMADSDKDEFIPYDVTVKTSSFTTSAENVSAAICIFGEKKATAMVQLSEFGDTRKVFDTNQQHIFQFDAVEVGDVKKIKLQLITSGPAAWGVEHVIVKFKSEYMTFPVNQIIEQRRDAKDQHLASRRYQTTLQLFPEQKEEPLIPYQVTVKTKNYEGFSADTTSEVYIVLFGDNGNSGRLWFGDNVNKKLFDKNSSHVFNLKAKDIGNLTNVRLIHTNNETTGNWFVDYVKVKAKDYDVQLQANQWTKKAKYSNQLRIDMFAPRNPGEENESVAYEVRVKTGILEEADTNKPVTIQLHGKYEKSGPIFLNSKITKDGTLFRKGMENTFTILQKNLGPIQRINLGHDDNGHGGRWFVESVNVSSPSQSLVFTANQWLESDTATDFFPTVADNNDLVTYHVITKTGTLPEASTDANVYVVFVGDNGETGHELLGKTAGGYDLFEHDQEDILTIKVPNVGHIHSMKIGHDNTGRSANWYLEGVDVLHPTHNESIDFSALCWLGDNNVRRDGGDQTVEKELFSVPESEEEGMMTYMIEIKTGTYEGSPDAKVQICIIGENSNTGMLKLEHASGNNSQIFNRSGRNLFTLKALDVGPLYKIKLVHNNPEGDCGWFVDFVVVKTKMYYKRINIQNWLTENEATGRLMLDIVPPEDENAQIKYTVTLKTGNYHGFNPDSEADPVWLCIFGEKGNTGMVNWKQPEFDKTEIFDKNNKHYLTMHARDVGTLTGVRVLHTNDDGNVEWKIDWVRVVTEAQDVRFKSKKWMDKTDCNKRLQTDMYAPSTTGKELIPYKVKVKTGGTAEAGTHANVYVNFHGTYGESGNIALKDEDSELSSANHFQKNQEDEFMVFGPDIGRLYKVSLGHDDSTMKARWFVSTVSVEVPQYEQTLYFTPEGWIDSKSGAKKKAEIDLYPKAQENPDNKTTYHITVKTADLANASTDANVFMILYGAQGNTGRIEMDAHSHGAEDLFEQDNEDLFSVITADVGPIRKITIGHDDQGESGDWYVKWVNVVCPSHSYSDIFMLDRWISSDKGDKRTQCDVLPVSQKDMDISYELTIMTANYRGYGEAYGKVYAVLYGRKYNTGKMEIPLPAGDKDQLFDKNNKHAYELSGIDVGEVKKIRIIHENKTGKSEWKVKWVEVSTNDMKRRVRINDWLPVEGDMLQGEYQLPAE